MRAFSCAVIDKLAGLQERCERFPHTVLFQPLATDENDSRKSESKKELKFRFYNFARNPMMVRLAEGVVDAVFELKGQALHDVVPGPFIALQAGAAMRDPDTRKSITVEDLGVRLANPSTDPSTIS